MLQRAGYRIVISKEEVRRIAQLARLEFSPQEEEDMAQEMGTILAHMKTLEALDTRGIPPMTHVLDLKGVAREDVVRQSITTEDALQNAPDTHGDFFRVPKVLG